MKRKREDDSGPELTQPARFSDLVNYQKGSVVSRTIINTKFRAVTISAFDKGERLSEHTSPFTTLIYLIDGQAKGIITGQSRVLGEGEAILVPVRIPHALKAKEGV